MFFSEIFAVCDISSDGEPASLGCGVVSEIFAVCDISGDGEPASLG